jgi:hypothetical protein
MAGPATPMLALMGVSEANHFINTGGFDLKILVMGGIATGLLALFGEIPGMEPTATAIGWLAFLAMCIAPIQNPSPAENLLKITRS